MVHLTTVLYYKYHVFSFKQLPSEFPVLKMKVTCSFETSVEFKPTAWCYTIEH
jgi:hypothetical protein